MKTKIISILTQKGGVGKTTTTIHLGAALAAKRKSVLLIDFDSQRSLSEGYNISEESSYTVLDFCLNRPGLEFYKRGNRGELYVLAGSEDIENIFADISTREKEQIRFILKNQLDKLLKIKHFDYVIIDCPPRPVSNNISLGEIALYASNFVISPIDADKYSLKGVLSLITDVAKLKANYGLSVEFLGFFFNRVSLRSKLYKKYKNDYLQSSAKDFLFATTIRQDVNVSYAQEDGLTIFQVAPKSRASVDFKNLVKEIINKIEYYEQEK